MHVTQLISENQFDAGWWLDWGNNYGPPGSPASNCPVPQNFALKRRPRSEGRMTDVQIQLQQTTAWIYSSRCRLQYCGSGMINCNAWAEDSLLIAPSQGETLPTKAAIRISFSKPLSAVGAYVRAIWRAGSDQATFEGRLWVLLATGGPGVATWRQPFTQIGKVGEALAIGLPRGVPFLGAESSQPNIVGAAFDIAPIGHAALPEVAITNLLAKS